MARNKVGVCLFYLRFPHPTNEIREKWIKVVQKNRSEDTWLPSDYSNICSSHFREEDKYLTKTGRVFLKKSAVPYDDVSATNGNKICSVITHYLH